MSVTIVVVAIAAVSLVALSLMVSLRRTQVGPAIGIGTDDVLLRRIRAHGNFCEFVPLGLILLAVAENAGTSTAWLVILAVLLVLGRVLHAAGMLAGNTPVRASGMLGTYASLLLGSVLVLSHLS